MSIGLKSDSSGTSGSIVINGSDKVVVTSAGNVTAGTFTGALTGSLTAGGSVTSGVAVNSTSGTAIDFTGIPSWAKQVKVVFNGVSTNGVSAPRIRLGTSGGFATSGYLGSCLGNATTNVSNLAFSAGFDINDGAIAAATRFGIFTFICIDTSNNWVLSGSQSQGNSAASSLINGTVPLGGTLTQIRITTVNGTDTFDAGSINIMYEG
jgi:hypothetical protein